MIFEITTGRKLRPVPIALQLMQYLLCIVLYLIYTNPYQCNTNIAILLNSKFLTRKSSGSHQEKRRKEHEEQEGMPPRQHCPPLLLNCNVHPLKIAHHQYMRIAT
jgi:hypothetical protein